MFTPNKPYERKGNCCYSSEAVLRNLKNTSSVTELLAITQPIKNSQFINRNHNRERELDWDVINCGRDTNHCHSYDDRSGQMRDGHESHLRRRRGGRPLRRCYRKDARRDCLCEAGDAAASDPLLHSTPFSLRFTRPAEISMSVSPPPQEKTLRECNKLCGRKLSFIYLLASQLLSNF